MRVVSKLFKANLYSSSEIRRQCDPLSDVSLLNDLMWSDAELITLPESYRHWLQHSGSLTAKLQQATHELSLQLLTAGWVSVGHSTQMMRQVLLSSGSSPWVWGLTLADSKSLLGEPTLSNWATQPLGQLLFADNTIEARHFDVTEFSQHALFSSMLLNWGCPQTTTQALWGRRSQVAFRSCALTLVEFFLPEHPMYGV